MWILKRLEALEHWRKHMDAQVTALTGEVTTLKQDVTALATAMEKALAAIAAAHPAIDAEDEAAITAAVVDLQAVHAGLQVIAAKAPTGAPAPLPPPAEPPPAA